ncbi:hypothetical protein [Bradyrhizobium septentrionale]|uniref:hypothetical protein n=1 Tax=Bradyrhizobium septentrionale TaxID=1404411 RepID=UPI001F33E0EA|nr:hypothetical protein [Bradyrhizobium septentrionale]UGY20877.1 hypothetical protein HAP48_0003080 [Bradyrhizobium septentrionale]
MSNKIDQQIEHTRLQWDLVPRAQQDAASFIKLEQSKSEGHVYGCGLGGKGSGKDQTKIRQ